MRPDALIFIVNHLGGREWGVYYNYSKVVSRWNVYNFFYLAVGANVDNGHCGENVDDVAILFLAEASQQHSSLIVGEASQLVNGFEAPL